MDRFRSLLSPSPSGPGPGPSVVPAFLISRLAFHLQREVRKPRATRRLSKDSSHSASNQASPKLNRNTLHGAHPGHNLGSLTTGRRGVHGSERFETEGRSFSTGEQLTVVPEFSLASLHLAFSLFICSSRRTVRHLSPHFTHCDRIRRAYKPGGDGVETLTSSPPE